MNHEKNHDEKGPNVADVSDVCDSDLGDCKTKKKNETSAADDKGSIFWKLTSESNQLSSYLGDSQHMATQVAKAEAEGIPRPSNHVSHSFFEGKFGPETAESVIAFQITNCLFYEIQNLHRNLHGATDRDELIEKIISPAHKFNAKACMLPNINITGNCYKNDIFYLITGKQHDDHMGVMEVDTISMFRWVKKCMNRSTREITLGHPLQCFENDLGRITNSDEAGLYNPPRLVGHAALKAASPNARATLITMLDAMQRCSDTRWGRQRFFPETDEISKINKLPKLIGAKIFRGHVVSVKIQHLKKVTTADGSHKSESTSNHTDGTNCHRSDRNVAMVWSVVFDNPDNNDELIRLLVIIFGSKSLGDYCDKERNPKVAEICKELIHCRDNCTDYDSVSLNEYGVSHVCVKTHQKITVPWSQQVVKEEKIKEEDDEATRLDKGRRNKELVKVAQLSTAISRESYMSTAASACRKLFLKPWFNKEIHCAMILFIVMQCNNQVMPYSVFNDWDQGHMMEGEPEDSEGGCGQTKTHTMDNEKKNTHLVKKFYLHSVHKHCGTDGGIGWRNQPYAGDWTISEWWNDDTKMKSIVDTLNEHMCISRIGKVDSIAIYKELEKKLPKYSHVAKIMYFQFMALMGWLGSEAVIVTDNETEETTVGGVYHGTAADGVGSAGIKKMELAGICDEKQQQDLFEKITNLLQFFPSHTEQSFCEAFREKVVFDTFVCGQSLHRLMWSNEEDDGRMVLRLMEKSFGSCEWKRCVHHEYDCKVWLKEVCDTVMLNTDN